MNTFDTMIARKASSSDEFNEIEDLLRSSKLPVADLKVSDVDLYGFYEDNELVASGAIEKVDGFRLLRSLSVKSGRQGKGLGKLIVTFLEDFVKDISIKEVYIITEVPSFFQKIGYEVVERTDTPEPIKNTEEFSTLCAETATIMKKDLI